MRTNNSTLCQQLGLAAWLGSCLAGFANSPIEQTNYLGMKMIRLEAGTFQMGSDAIMPGQTDRFSFSFVKSDDLLNVPPDWDEFPRRKVTISKPFYISQTEVTVEQYRKFKPGFKGSNAYGPYATGVSWHEAMAYCRWLSEKEGKPYRLPTEAEWEYACRARTDTPFSSGNQPPEPDSPNPWGLLNMHSGALEWCLDWHGVYPHDDLIDPAGPAHGIARVVRGGPLDREERMLFRLSSFYRRSANRAGMAPGFRQIPSQDGEDTKPEDFSQPENGAFFPGLVGNFYNSSYLTRPSSIWPVEAVDSDQMDWPSSNDWSAAWRGFLEAPMTGSIKFFAEVNNGLRLEIDGRVVIDGWEQGSNLKGSFTMEKGRKYPFKLSYFTDGGGSFLRLFWSYSGQKKTIVPAKAFWHSEANKHFVGKEVLISKMPRENSVGFRVVQAPMSATQPHPFEAPFAMQGVRQNVAHVKKGPSLGKPYFRKRIMLPIPLENSSREAIDAAGFQPSFRGHNHSPALEVCSNGDLLLVIYTSYNEYEPGVSLMAARLRFGADQWDMPSSFMDFPDANDHAPLLWNDNGKLRFFWGNPQLDGGYPFQWAVSTDNGASFDEIKFPVFQGPVLSHSRQPINSAFRGLDNTLYVASDGVGGASVLWASKDDGATWFDTGGRSGGRHTTFAQLKNGDILGLGGKNTNIEGFMPKSVSSDGGKTWKVSRTPFAALASNQRPTIIRLQSGRLFFAADYQKRGGGQPLGITQKGAFAALSEDEGKTWKIKKIPGALLHETDQPWGETLGYAVARQAPNGIIHLITTMNHPSLHFALNEAWILSEKGNYAEQKMNDPYSGRISKVEHFEEKHSNGKSRIEGSGGIADDGRYLLEGPQVWNNANGNKKWEAAFERGRKVGKETYWNMDGKKIWQWEHDPKGISRWTQWWPNGQLKAQSTWKNGRCEGLAKTWDYYGNLISEVEFSDGKPAG